MTLHLSMQSLLQSISSSWIKSSINNYSLNEVVVKLSYQPTLLTGNPLVTVSTSAPVTRLSRLLVISHPPDSHVCICLSICVSVCPAVCPHSTPGQIYVRVWWFWELLCSTSIQAGQAKCLKMTEIPPKLIVHG